jgi:sucrose-6-phosphate hydrolase SacC (GH32 family)
MLRRFILIFAAVRMLAADRTYDETYRPQFHFSPKVNWTNDPCGLVYFGGKYHLFFQHNPVGDLWGH